MKAVNMDLTNRLWLAPMAEVTDAPFRIISKKFGAGLTFTQMVSAKGVVENEFETLQYLAFSKNEKPIGVQILANDPHTLAHSVSEVKKYSPDIIDLNCGCPVNKVTRCQMGATILDNPKLLGDLIKAMKDTAGDTPISIKMRLGKNKTNISIIENARIAQENGADYIIVHTRTREDRYSVDADWNWLSKIKENIDVPVIGNGSIFSAQDAYNMIKETGCDGVMVARGALGNPFLFSRFDNMMETGIDPGEPSILQIKETVIEHLNLLIREYGEIRAIHRAKKFIIWYFRFSNGISSLIENLIKINDVQILKEFIEEHTNKIINDFYPPDDLNDIDNLFKRRVLFWLEENKVIEAG